MTGGMRASLKQRKGMKSLLTDYSWLTKKKGACSNEHAPGVFMRDIMSRELD
jgi:hypothetical protein